MQLSGTAVHRWADGHTCKSLAGFQSESNRISLEAPTMFRPVPPALLDSRKRNWSPYPLLKRWTMSTRFAVGVDPSSRCSGKPASLQSSSISPRHLVELDTTTQRSCSGASRSWCSICISTPSFPELPVWPCGQPPDGRWSTRPLYSDSWSGCPAASATLGSRRATELHSFFSASTQTRCGLPPPPLSTDVRLPVRHRVRTREDRSSLYKRTCSSVGRQKTT